MTEPQADDTPHELPSLTGLMDGFGGYFEPASETWDATLLHGLVVLDANAILDAYRMSPHSRDEFLLLEELHERLFVPHQVVREFHKNRIDVVRKKKDEFEEFAKETKKRVAATKAEIDRHADMARPGIENAKDVADSLGAAFAQVQELVDKLKSGYDLDPGRMIRGEDPVLPRLEKILEGRVNRRPSESQLHEDRAEAKRRRERKIPPGFGDADKEDPDGDYLWWAEVVRHVAVDRRPILVVTNDVTKGDWTFSHGKNRVGAHPLLVEEIHRAAGVPLLLATVSELLTRAQRILQTKVDESTVREVDALREFEAGKTQVVTVDSLQRLINEQLADSLLARRSISPVPHSDVFAETISQAWRRQIGESLLEGFTSSLRQHLLDGAAHSASPTKQEDQAEEDPSDEDPNAADR